MVKRKKADDQSDIQPSKRAKQATLKLDGSITKKDVSIIQDVRDFKIPSKGKDVPCERRGRNGKPSLIFTHGAGGGLSNAATKDFAEGFSEVSPVVSFQGTGGMNVQARVRGFQAVLEHEDVQCALGGRSMGARAAVMAAMPPEAGIRCLVLVSYPMFGAQKGDSREQILLDLPENMDVMFVSGSNDSMCDLKHLRKVMKEMKARAWLVEVTGADHGMTLKPKAGTEAMVKQTGRIAANWLLERNESTPYCSLSWEGAEQKAISTGWKATS